MGTYSGEITALLIELLLCALHCVKHMVLSHLVLNNSSEVDSTGIFFLWSRTLRHHHCLVSVARVGDRICLILEPVCLFITYLMWK